MYPKELQSGVTATALFGLFIDLFNKIKETGEFMKLNKIEGSIGLLFDTNVIEQKIRKMWDQNQDLLSGVLVYIHSQDVYFNPDLNTEDLFFRKIFTFNRDLLEKVGKGVVKPAFPFVNFDNHKKKIILIR